MTYLYIGLLLIVSYLIGSIQSGLIIGKVFKKIDIREHGSKNTGATNAIRVLGFKYGIWAFLFDTIKGALMISVLKYTHATDFYMINELNFISIYGFVAVLGHVFSVFNHFKGGKAVATSLGAILAIEPIIAIIIGIVFLTVFLITRYVSLGSTYAAITTIVGFIIRLFIPIKDMNIESKIFEIVVFILLASLIFIKHKANYQRLKTGTEHKM